MISEDSKSLIALHSSVMLFGFAGLFGRLNISPIVVVLGRVFFASIFLGCLLVWRRKHLRLSIKNLLLLVVAGFVLAIHWLTFFYSISISSVSVGLISFSSFPVVIVFLEPIFFKTHIKAAHIFTAIAVLFAIFIIVPDFNLSNSITKGVFWGVMSGFTFSLITLLNRRYVQDINPLLISFIQDASAFIALVPFGLMYIPVLNVRIVSMLLLLGVICTGVAHTLYIYGLKHTSARKASIFTSLEPVYGAAAAFIILHEIPEPHVVAGGLIIVSISAYISMSGET